MKTITVVVALLVSVSAFAHHNYRLRFDYDVNVEMDVVVTKFDWKNPHIEILVDVENDDGTTTPWIMPTMTPGVANRLGITPDTLQAGDRIHVTGAPARNGSNELLKDLVVNIYTLHRSCYRRKNNTGASRIRAGAEFTPFLTEFSLTFIVLDQKYFGPK